MRLRDLLTQLGIDIHGRAFHDYLLKVQATKDTTATPVDELLIDNDADELILISYKVN